MKLLNTFRAAFALLMLLGATAARADFVDDLHKRFPQSIDAKVEKSFGDFYAVTRGSEVVYIDSTMHYMINGDVVDLTSNKSLTSALREANRPKLNVADLHVEDAIVIGNGNDKIYVFSDPDCPYCRNLQTEIEKLHGVTAYVFPYPLASLHPNATTQAESIWCAKDRAAAWSNYVGKGQAVQKATCSNPIAKNIELGAKNHIIGTPAIVFANGSMVPGYINAHDILARIDDAKAK